MALLLTAMPAFAYNRARNAGGVYVFWATHGHPFQLDAQGTPDVPQAAAFSAIRNSFLTWAGIACSDLSFPEERLSLDPKDRVIGYFPGQANHNLVLFRVRRCGNGTDGGVVPPGDPCLTQGGCGNAYDCWDHGDGVIATTTTTSNRSSGQISDSDIELNDAPGLSGTAFTFTALDGPPCTSATETGCVRIDIQNTVTHEAGHTLGLDHSSDPGATMYATAPQGETSKRILGSDDVRAICDIYPKGSGGCGCSHGQTGPGAALGVLTALLLRRRRRVPLQPG